MGREGAIGWNLTSLQSCIHWSLSGTKQGKLFLPGLIQIKIFLCLLLIAIFSFNNENEKGIFKYTSIQYYNEV